MAARSRLIWLVLVAALGCGSPAPNTPTKMSPQQPASAGGKAANVGPAVGQQAPAFEVADESGAIVRLADHRDKRAVLLAFYPKDFTGG